MTPRPTAIVMTHDRSADGANETFWAEMPAESPFLVTRTPDAERVGPNIQFVLNNQGAILNATFTSQRTSDAARIGRFIADHNGAMAELRINSRLGDLK